jgi:hypothetical protein
MPRGSTEECAAVVGLDWADAQHDGCVQASDTARREVAVLDPRPEAIEAWGGPLRPRCNGQPVGGSDPTCLLGAGVFPTATRQRRPKKA